MDVRSIQDIEEADVFQPGDPVWRQIACYEMPKIAMRSMEHGSHPGRFLNDFRKQFSGSPVVYSTILGYGPPGRIFANLLALFVFERLLFGSYYANVEKPFIHFPARPEDEPEDFTPGAEQMERLLPYIEFLAEEIARFFPGINASFEDVPMWMEGLAKVEHRVRTLVEQSPRFEIPTKMFDDTALIKYQPEDVILEFRQLERFVKIFLYSVREEAPPDNTKVQLLRQVLAVLISYRQALNHQWGQILYQNRTTGVRQDMRGRAAEYVASGCAMLASEVAAMDAGNPSPEIPENPEEPAAGQTMDIELFREMVTYSVDAEAFIASKALAHEIALDRVQFAKRASMKTDLNLTEIVSSLPDQIKPEGEERLDVMVPHDVDIFVSGNERRIRGLFTNLITNSFQFGKHMRIRLEYDPTRERAIVRLSDNGRGVHPDLLTWDDVSRRVTIFKLGQTRRRADLGAGAGGTGVGTTESFWDAEMHGGKLTLEETVRAPNPAQGTTFLIELPATARSLWTRHSVDGFIALLQERCSPGVVEAVAQILTSPDRRKERLLTENGLIVREEGDALNRDTLQYVNAVVISQSLLNMDAGIVRLVMEEYLLPIELDRLDPRIFISPSAAARRAVALLRCMARFGNMRPNRREQVLSALERCEQAMSESSSTLPPLTPILRASITRNLSGREYLALSRAIEEQKRTYLATEGLDRLYREVQRLSKKMRGMFIRRPTGARLQRLLQQKAQALVTAIQGLLREEEAREGLASPDEQQVQLERTHLIEFVNRSLVEPVGERLGDFPVDWRSLIVYLAEHGQMARVLEEIPSGHIKDWLEEMDKALPLAAAFLDPQLHGEEYEHAIDDPTTPVHTRLMLKSDLPQIAMLTDLQRVREARQFLLERALQPKPRGLDYVRPILKRVMESTASLGSPSPQPPSDVEIARSVDAVIEAEPTTSPTTWEQWLTYLAKLHTGAVLSQVSLMSDEELRRLRAVVEAGTIVSDVLLTSGLFDHLLERYTWWQESLQVPAERFDNLIAQVAQIYAQTSLPLMEDALSFASRAIDHWFTHVRRSAERGEPPVSEDSLLCALRSITMSPWLGYLPEATRTKVRQMVGQHGSASQAAQGLVEGIKIVAGSNEAPVTG